MEEHFFETIAGDPPHYLALSKSDLSVWCYSCNEYVTKVYAYFINTSAAFLS